MTLRIKCKMHKPCKRCGKLFEPSGRYMKICEACLNKIKKKKK